MTITSCWNGSCYELFSSEEKAVSAAEEIIRDCKRQCHPMGDCFVSQLIEKDPKAYVYWFKPAQTITKTIMNEKRIIQVPPEESPGCIAGDDSPEVAAAVAQWWRDRDARA